MVGWSPAYFTHLDAEAENFSVTVTLAFGTLWNIPLWISWFEFNFGGAI